MVAITTPSICIRRGIVSFTLLHSIHADQLRLNAKNSSSKWKTPVSPSTLSSVLECSLQQMCYLLGCSLPVHSQQLVQGVSNPLRLVPDTEQVLSMAWAVGRKAAVTLTLSLSARSNRSTIQTGTAEHRAVLFQGCTREREADSLLTIRISSIICFSCTNSVGVIRVAAPELGPALAWDPREGGRARINKKVRSLPWFLSAPSSVTARAWTGLGSWSWLSPGDTNKDSGERVIAISWLDSDWTMQKSVTTYRGK